MAVPFSNTKLRVPRGFQNLLEGLAREVLRKQPDNVYEFGAKYFEALMEIRENEGIDPVAEGAKLEDRFYNNKSFKKPDLDPSDPSQQDAALKIQTKYRQHAATEKVQTKREEVAATKIQAGYRGHQDRERVKEKQDGLEEEEEIDIDLDDPEVEKAATKIQAGFKGMKARKQVQELKETPSEAQAADEGKKSEEAEGQDQGQAEGEEIDIDLEDPEVEKAATLIQAGFKGMKARKEVKDKKSDIEKSEAEAENKQEEEEEIDIDLTDPDVEKAATKIQAGFKGMKARKDVQAMKESSEEPVVKEPVAEVTEQVKDEPAAEVTEDVKDEPAAEVTEEVKDEKPAQEEEEVDIDLTDPEVEKAATKIQAGFKGMKVRKEAKERQGTTSSTAPEPQEIAPTSSVAPQAEPEAEAEPQMETTAESEQKKDDEEEIDIDLNDPEVEKAATKIQAGFKGMKARKEVKERKEGQTTTDETMAEEPEDETPPKAEQPETETDPAPET